MSSARDRSGTWKRRLAALDASNAEVATVIQANPQRFSGLPLEWARLFTQRRKNHVDCSTTPGRR